tara:strand:+ start:301 stop:516 length:216 start_codon:yes stop_codon:yes gene_type:complete
MFNNLVTRLGLNLGLTEEEAIKSELVKKLCVQIIYGQIVVIDSNRENVSSFNPEIIVEANNSAKSYNDSLR